MVMAKDLVLDLEEGDKGSEDSQMDETQMVEVLWHCAFCVAADDETDGGRSAELFGTKAAFVWHFARVCHICPAAFTCAASLAAHRSRHASADAQHVCNVCEARSETREQFHVHKRAHRPYRCVGCKQSFKTMLVCVSHVRTGCEAARRRLLRLRRLNDGKGRVLDIDGDAVCSPRPSGSSAARQCCFACDKAFPDQDDLARHFLWCYKARCSDVDNLAGRIGMEEVKRSLRRSLEAPKTLSDCEKHFALCPATNDAERSPCSATPDDQTYEFTPEFTIDLGGSEGGETDSGTDAARGQKRPLSTTSAKSDAKRVKRAKVSRDRRAVEIERLFCQLAGSISPTDSVLDTDVDYLAFLIGVGQHWGRRDELEDNKQHSRPTVRSPNPSSFDAARCREEHGVASCVVDLGRRLVNPFRRRTLNVYCARVPTKTFMFKDRHLVLKNGIRWGDLDGADEVIDRVRWSVPPGDRRQDPLLNEGVGPLCVVEDAVSGFDPLLDGWVRCEKDGCGEGGGDTTVTNLDDVEEDMAQHDEDDDGPRIIDTSMITNGDWDVGMNVDGACDPNSENDDVDQDESKPKVNPPENPQGTGESAPGDGEGTSEKKKTWPCDVCGKVYTSRKSRWCHQRTHSGKVFPCSVCDKTFKTSEVCKEHELIHFGPRHQCPMCPKQFAQKSNLRRHVKIHLGVKEHKCRHCDAAFVEKSSRDSHERKHTGERFQCDECDMSYSTPQKLRYHQRLHTGEGLYRCHLCERESGFGRVFNNPYSMKEHLRLVHLRAAGEPAAEGRGGGEACAFCGLTLASAKSLGGHLAKLHKEQGKACAECGFEANSLLELNGHVVSEHRPAHPPSSSDNSKSSSAPGHVCLHCNATFPSMTDMRSHLRDSHGIDRDYSLHYTNNMVRDHGAVVNPNVNISNSSAVMAVAVTSRVFEDGSVARVVQPVQGGSNDHRALRVRPEPAGGAKECAHCGKRIGRLSKHLKQFTTMGTTCVICGETFVSRARNNTHLLEAHPLTPFPPEYLGFVPDEGDGEGEAKHEDGDKVEEEEEEESGDQVTREEFQERTKDRDQVLKDDEPHQEEAVKDEDEELRTSPAKPKKRPWKKPQSCAHCGQQMSHLSRHLQRFTTMGTTCVLCGAAFKYITETNAHLLEHHSDAPFPQEYLPLIDEHVTSKVDPDYDPLAEGWSPRKRKKREAAKHSFPSLGEVQDLRGADLDGSEEVLLGSSRGGTDDPQDGKIPLDVSAKAETPVESDPLASLPSSSSSSSRAADGGDIVVSGCQITGDLSPGYKREEDEEEETEEEAEGKEAYEDQDEDEDVFVERVEAEQGNDEVLNDSGVFVLPSGLVQQLRGIDNRQAPDSASSKVQIPMAEDNGEFGKLN